MDHSFVTVTIGTSDCPAGRSDVTVSINTYLAYNTICDQKLVTINAATYKCKTEVNNNIGYIKSCSQYKNNNVDYCWKGQYFV